MRDYSSINKYEAESLICNVALIIKANYMTELMNFIIQLAKDLEMSYSDVSEIALREVNLDSNEFSEFVETMDLDGFEKREWF